ncbi:hypothetical protein PFISCL1PPCAC_10120, partial [Pristionchus fissidentatus]
VEMTGWSLLPLLLLPLKVDSYMGAMMGVLNQCDDGKTRLEVDWDPDDFTQYTCPTQWSYAVREEVEEIYYAMPNFNAQKDVVGHKCMNETISYNDTIPLRGDHRPNWPVYGEYLYVPPQRWLHNLEHGSIILLYHPCVDEDELSKLRTLLTGCIYRHIITPFNKLTEDRPLALVGWGARLIMSRVNQRSVVKFIRKHAHIAPEDISKNGLYSLHLIQPSQVVSSKKDLQLCPTHPPNPDDPTVPPAPPNSE